MDKIRSRVFLLSSSVLAQPEMHEKEDEAHGDGESQVSLTKASWLTQQWEKEPGLHPGTEVILNCYVHVNINAFTLSPFTYNSVLPKDWKGFTRPSTLPKSLVLSSVYW